MLRVLTIVLIGALLCAPALSSEETYQTQGWQNRPYRVFRPDTPAGGGAFPVVLVFHGGGGDIDGIVRATGMDETAEKYGFLAVYPSGTKARIGKFRTWNAGDCCGRAAEKNVDDMAYVAAVLDDLAKRYVIDRARVYATGHSNGGMISWRLACERPDLVAAIAPNAGAARLETLHCVKGPPVPVLHFHGTADPCATYKSGPCGDCFGEALRARGIPMPPQKRMCVGAVEQTAQWAAFEGCKAETHVTLKSGAATCTEHLFCPVGAAVKLCSLEGAGHTWPGGRDDINACARDPEGKACKDWRALVGPINRDISANEMMWAFFQKYHR
ncbi:MAG: PHB depolymerase family esterase [Alphaproteobacteria bacterium]